ncbi:MAG TPA: N-acetylglucosamine-6-phosphate deacetylase, partial [Candidatus Faecivicinus avistercoris]|nr:N-acetylglucosamine-6-phosphate deacetylase [Candidatus Faecivicinus avistercoris]
MKAIVNGRIVAPHAVIRGKVLLYDERVIGIVDPGETPEGVETLDAKGNYVIPGLVDMHIHGYMGEDASDGSFEG